MVNLPIYVSLTFVLITLITTILFYYATNKNNKVLFFVMGLLSLHGILAINGFFLITDTVPPRFPLLVLPSIIGMIMLFTTTKGKLFIDSINLETYTYLHTIRIVVEIVLLCLFLGQLIPESMTFEGQNFDILSGLTAPFVAYFGYKRKTLHPKMILAWNVTCLLLLLQVVVTATLSAPSTIQQFAFDQPNIAILNFPFAWLPSVVVPIVIFGHLVAIRRYFVGNA